MEINQYIEEEIFRLVNQAMDSLPSTYKQVITLTLEGYRVKEIAEKLAVSEQTVKNQLGDITRRLRCEVSRKNFLFFI